MMPKPVAIYHWACIVILISLSVPGCSSGSKIPKENLDAIAKSKLGSAFTIKYNESKTFALCEQVMGAGDHSQRSFKFIVVRVSDNSVTNEGSFRNGHVKWISDSSIEVRSSGLDEKSQTKIIPINDQQS
jgi:hypothetical protein